MTLEPKKRRDPSIDRPITNQCTAHRRNGDQCRRSAIKGGTVCPTHGGAAPAVQRAAQVRLLMASDTVAGELVKIALSKKASDSVRVQAILAVLDRAGISARQQIEISATVETWESKIQGAVVDWGELGQYIPSSDASTIDAEVVDEAHEQAWDRRLEAPHDAPPRTTPTEAERQVAALPVKAPLPEPTPPWLSDESGAETATRLADEHRQAAFAADKAGRSLTPRTTRRR